MDNNYVKKVKLLSISKTERECIKKYNKKFFYNIKKEYI